MKLKKWAILFGIVLLAACGGDDSDGESENSGISNDAGTPEPTTEVDGGPNLPSGTPLLVKSEFDEESIDGWTITNNDIPLRVSTDGTCGLVSVEPLSDFLCTDADSDGGTSYYLAPEKFHGDLNVYSTLNFSLVAAGGRYFDSGFGFDGDVVISNGVEQAAYTFAAEQRPTEVFSDYQIPLKDDANWITSDGAALSTILQSVTELRIRAEYGVGTDNSGLDDVSLQ